MSLQMPQTPPQPTGACIFLRNTVKKPKKLLWLFTAFAPLAQRPQILAFNG